MFEKETVTYFQVHDDVTNVESIFIALIHQQKLVSHDTMRYLSTVLRKALLLCILRHNISYILGRINPGINDAYRLPWFRMPLNVNVSGICLCITHGIIFIEMQWIIKFYEFQGQMWKTFIKYRLYFFISVMPFCLPSLNVIVLLLHDCVKFISYFLVSVLFV